MSYRILFVLAIDSLFAQVSWSDNESPPNSVSAVFNPQSVSIVSPPDLPLNDDCTRAIPLESGVKVWGSTAQQSSIWYSFLSEFNGTLQVTLRVADPNMDTGVAIYESCEGPNLGASFGGGHGMPLVFFQEVKQNQVYYLSINRHSLYGGAFSIQADFCSPSVPGDLCIEAIEMAPNTSIHGSTIGACGGKGYCYPCASNRGIWYKFAPSVEGCVRISVTAEDDKCLGLYLFDSCGGSDLGGTYSYSGHETLLCFLDVSHDSDYRLQIIQDAASTASFLLETQIVPTIPVVGRVVDKTTGEGIGGVPLELWGEEYNHQSGWSTRTDSGGNFTFAKSLPAGIYSLRISRFEFEDHQLWDLDGHVTLTVGMGPLVLEMVRQANLEIVCVDAETAEPITETMQLYFYPYTGRSSYTYQNSPNTCSASPGLYQVVSSPKDSANPYAQSREWVDLKSGEDRTCIMSMKKGVPIRGTVRDVYGNPPYASWIALYGENGIFGNLCWNGTFQAWIPPGVYGCWAESEDCDSNPSSPWQQITVSQDAERNADLELILYGDSNAPTYSEWILQHPDSLDHAGPFDVLAVPQGIVPAPDNIFTFQDRWLNPWGGHYECAGMEESHPAEVEYDLYFGILVRTPPGFSFTALAPKLEIPDGTEKVQVSYTSEGSTVAGMVLDPEGIPILMPEVLLNKTPGEGFAGWAQVNPRGQFVLYHVPAGTYTLSAVHRNYTTAQTTVTILVKPAILTAETLTMTSKGRHEGADFNGDGIVDLDDLSNLTANWMQYGTFPADIDHSGTIDMPDLARMSQIWLGQAIWLNRPAQFPAYPESLIGLWTLDEQVDLKTVLDWSGNGRHGKAQQNLSAITQEGMVNFALRFDGTGDYIDCGPVDPLQPAAWTVCAWVKCADTPTPTLLSFGGNFPAVKLQQNNKGRPIVYLGPYNYRYFSASAWTTLKDGLWHHVAFSVPGGEQDAVERATMYLDGVPVAESTTRATGPQADKSRLYLGITSKAGQQRFKGAMDEVLLFDRVLSTDEIERIYQSSR